MGFPEPLLANRSISAVIKCMSQEAFLYQEALPSNATLVKTEDTECIAFEFYFSEILEYELPFIHRKGKEKVYKEIFTRLQDIVVF